MTEIEVKRTLRDAVAACFDPPAWSGREKRTDHWRRTHSLKKADAAIAAVFAKLDKLASDERVSDAFWDALDALRGKNDDELLALPTPLQVALAKMKEIGNV